MDLDKREDNIWQARETTLTGHAYFMTVFNLRYLGAITERFPVGLALKIMSLNVNSLHNHMFVCLID